MYIAAARPRSMSQTVTTLALNETITKGAYEPVSFVDNVIQETINLGASDLFFEPQSDTIRVRVRIDGTLYDVGRLAPSLFSPIAARIKLLGKLDSVEKKKIREGQLMFEHQGRRVNLRVEIVETVHGDFIVIRIHERKTIVMELSELGFSETANDTYRNLLKSINGLILVCGPTGCGKTTTIYSTLNHMNKNQNYNIMTIEDPVEFQLYGINQIQADKNVGFTFTEGLRTILRLSPDIIFVGEIRDRDTAEIAIESGLTGHLVFSTLHATDSIGALFRLLDLDIETYFLNTALLGIVSQRLVRVNCDKCLEPYTPNQDERDLFQKVLGRPPQELKRSKGCPTCKFLAFKGRTAIHEILHLTPQLRELIRSHAPEDTIRESLKKEGFVSLIQDGLIKCEKGLTTVEQVARSSFVKDF